MDRSRGADTLSTADAGDTLEAGSGVDVLSSSGGYNTLIAGSGIDSLTSTGAYDTLEGNGGGSILTGDATTTALYLVNNFVANLSTGKADVQGASMSDTAAAPRTSTNMRRVTDS